MTLKALLRGEVPRIVILQIFTSPFAHISKRVAHIWKLRAMSRHDKKRAGPCEEADPCQYGGSKRSLHAFGSSLVRRIRGEAAAAQAIAPAGKEETRRENGGMLNTPEWLKSEKYLKHKDLGEIAAAVSYLQWLVALKQGLNHWHFDAALDNETIVRQQAALHTFIMRIGEAVDERIQKTLELPERSLIFLSALATLRTERQALLKLREREPGAMPPEPPHASAAVPKTIEPAPGYGSIRIYHRDA